MYRGIVSGCHSCTGYLPLKKPMAWKLGALRIFSCRMVIVRSKILRFHALVYIISNTVIAFSAVPIAFSIPHSRWSFFCVFLVLAKKTSMLIHWHLILLCWATVYIDICTPLLQPPSLHHKSPLYFKCLVSSIIYNKSTVG